MAIEYKLRKQLHGLLGRPVLHRGMACTVIEVLESEVALVLEVQDARGGLQDNQYGDPGRRVAETYTIPIFDQEDSCKLHPDLLALGLMRIE